MYVMAGKLRPRRGGPAARPSSLTGDRV